MTSHRIGHQIVLGIALLVGLYTIGGCKKKSVPAPSSAPPPMRVEVAPPQPVATPTEKPIYVYSGDRFRDPFLPPGLSSSYQPDAIFDPQKATLRGIIYGGRLDSAVLTVGGTGAYFVKDGRIIDIMGKRVEGFTAKIFVNRIVIYGEAENVYELKIRKDEQEEKTL